jgi:hypothetical protein
MEEKSTSVFSGHEVGRYLFPSKYLKTYFFTNPESGAELKYVYLSSSSETF